MFTTSIQLPSIRIAIVRTRKGQRVYILRPDILRRWGTECPHGHREAWESLELATIAARYPQDWCPRCEREGATA